MKFTLSRPTLSRTMILNPEGQFVYKINTTSGGRTTSVHQTNAYSSASSSSTTIISDNTSEVTMVEAKWPELAHIYWRNIDLSKVSCQLSDSCFTGEAVKSQFTFQDSRGRGFKWSLGSLGFGLPVLIAQESKNSIAQLRRPRGLFKSPRPYIEVDDEYLDFLDEIVVTLVYVEMKRKFMQEGEGPSPESVFSNVAYMSIR